MASFASEAMDTAREHHLPQWLELGERCMGWAMHGTLGDFWKLGWTSEGRA